MTPAQTTIGRWLIRLVPPGGTTAQGHRSDAEEPQVEILDTENAHPEHCPEGQFVSRYYASTLLGHPAGCGLDLHGGVPVWTMNAVEVEEMLRWITRRLSVPSREGGDLRSSLSRPRTCPTLVTA